MRFPCVVVCSNHVVVCRIEAVVDKFSSVLSRLVYWGSLVFIG